MSYWPALLPGSGDEMWAFSDAWSRVLHYRKEEDPRLLCFDVKKAKKVRPIDMSAAK